MTILANVLTSDGRAFDPALYRVLLRPLSGEEGGGWLATLPDLPGCTGDGETEIEAIEDVRRAALEWADAAARDGDPVPPPALNAVAAE